MKSSHRKLSGTSTSTGIRKDFLMMIVIKLVLVLLSMQKAFQKKNIPTYEYFYRTGTSTNTVL